MAHYALLDRGNVVKGVYVIDDAWEADGEAACALKCAEFFSAIDPQAYAGTWIKTSYNNKIRKRYAAIGGTYDAGLDAFIAPKPFPSWVFNGATCDWDAPVPYPGDGRLYWWDESVLNWVAQ